MNFSLKRLLLLVTMAAISCGTIRLLGPDAFLPLLALLAIDLASDMAHAARAGPTKSNILRPVGFCLVLVAAGCLVRFLLTLWRAIA